MPSQDPLADPALASFLDDLEVVATRPAPAPRPGLAAFFDGISPDNPIADSPAPVARRATRRRRMTVTELLGALMAKLAGLGMAAKAGLGLGVAAASVTTAGVANVLPDPAQHAVATVVNAVAPFDITDPADDPTNVVDDVEDVVGGITDDVTGELPERPEVRDVTILELGEGEGDGTGTDVAPRNHGACVSAVARNKTAAEGSAPNAHGKAVAEVARSDCGKQTAGSPTTTTTPVPTTTTTTVDGEVGASSRRGPGNSGNAGQAGANAGQGAANAGRGLGNGNGNPGNAGRR